MGQGHQDHVKNLTNEAKKTRESSKVLNKTIEASKNTSNQRNETLGSNKKLSNEKSSYFTTEEEDDLNDEVLSDISIEARNKLSHS